MKHILLIAILFVSTFSFAQYPMGGGMMGGRRTGMGNNYGNMATNTPAKERVFSAEERAQNLTDMMGKKLDLDSNQYAKTSEINLRYAKKQEEFMLISQTENLPNEIMYKK